MRIPIRLKQVYVCPSVDRNIFGSATVNMMPGVVFKRDPTQQMGLHVGESTCFALKVVPAVSSSYLWFQMRPVPQSRWTVEDREWLVESMMTNSATIREIRSYVGNAAMSHARQSTITEEVIAGRVVDDNGCNDSDNSEAEVFYDVA